MTYVCIEHYVEGVLLDNNKKQNKQKKTNNKHSLENGIEQFSIFHTKILYMAK